MNRPKDELIELLEIKTPSKEKSKRSNKINLSPLNSATYSISSVSEEALVNLFSVTHTTSTKHKNIRSGTPTISEISDNVFEHQTERVTATGKHKTYRQKISEHIKKIKEKASTPQSAVRFKSKFPVQKIRRESENVDAELELVRNKFHLNDVSSFNQEKDNFFKFYIGVTGQTENADLKKYKYTLPEQMTFNINLSEKELFFTPSKMRKLIDTKIKTGSIELSEVNTYMPEIPKYELSLLEQRILNDEDNFRKWFTTNGDLFFSANPTTFESFRPLFLYSYYNLPWIIYKQPKLYTEECEEVVVIEDKILDIFISHLTFTFHPLFSLEHVFAEKLQNLYEEYIHYQDDNVLNELKNNLSTCRFEKFQTESATASINKEIKRNREKYLNESRKFREICKSILDTWKNLKKIRTKQGYSNTKIKLLIKRTNTDLNTDLEEFNSFFELTIKEILYEQKIEKMNDDLSETENNLTVSNSTIQDTKSKSDKEVGQSQRSSTSKEVKMVEKYSVNEIEERESCLGKSENNKYVKNILSNEQIKEDNIEKKDGNTVSLKPDDQINNTSNQKDIEETNNIKYKSKERQKKKLKVNKENDKNLLRHEKIKNELFKKLKKSLRTPGEPIIKFILLYNNEVTKQNIPNTKETARRNVVNSTKFVLKIFCNNIEACKTKPLNLDDNFSLEIDEIFSLKLIDIPKFLTISIFELPKALQKRKICDLNILVPKIDSETKFDKKLFEKGEIIHYKHEGVGSGIDLMTAAEQLGTQITNKENCQLKTEGFIEFSIGWENKIKKKEIDNSFQTKYNLLNDVIDKNFVINTSKLKELTGEIEGIDIIKEDNEISSPSRTKGFRLNSQSQSLQFCNITEIEQNIRLKILQLRDQKEIEFDGMLVPNRIKEIPVNILSDYKRRKAMEEKGYFMEENDEYEEIENQRSFGKKYLKQVYIRVFQKCKYIENNLDYESVVDERILLYFHTMIKTLLRNFWNWFRWQPKISKPLPKLAKRSSQQESDKVINTSSNIFVLVTIISAKNVPNKTKSVSENDSVENEVQPFIRIDYKNVSARTETSKGKNPIWNEVLEIPLESSHADYLDPNSLEGNISINLFDESDLEIRKLNTKCSNWLGDLEISLSSICLEDGLHGFFKVRTPHVLFGYESEADKYKTKSPKITNPQLRHHTYIQMRLTLQSTKLPKLTPNMEELISGDIPYIEEHILKWNNAYNISFPSRKFSAIAIDANTKTTCITRYLRPLEPPQINLEEFDVTPEQCLKYVSLIPFTNCNHFYNNVWLSTEELIQLMMGSITDHAIALTCYLLALKMDVWLLLGYGIPHASTAYVLFRDYSVDTRLPTYYIYDVVAGDKYNLIDEFCPLQKIFCVANGENVWGNIQNHDNIPLTRFDFNRRSDWLPLFNNQISAPTNFVSNRVIYKEKYVTEELEVHLERQIKKQISKLRQLDRTIWNPHLSKIVKNILRSCEINSMYNKNYLEIMPELNTILSSHEVTGFGINMSFTSLSQVLKKIKSLGIHIQTENCIEFVVCVYVHPYAGNVLSVWILLASIKKLDNETPL